jgi:hypothetical protein
MKLRASIPPTLYLCGEKRKKGVVATNRQHEMKRKKEVVRTRNGNAISRERVSLSPLCKTPVGGGQIEKTGKKKKNRKLRRRKT